MNGLLRRIGSTLKTTAAIATLGSAAYGASQIKEHNDLFPSRESDANGKKKNVLVLPFHRMKIVEQKAKKPLLDSLQSLQRQLDEDKVVEVEISELVDAIHTAAADPDIVALYGTFGNGFKFQCGGYAHIEEIRNAIRVFNESHRRHSDADGNANGLKGEGEGEAAPKPKMSYAYSDTFESMDSGNQEYFLASAFSQVYLQARGNVNLYGVSMSNIFLGDFLQRYGIKAHVFKTKHGKYKNAPNIFTKSKYTKAHRENLKAIVDSLNNTVYASVAQSRNLPLVFNNKSTWDGIHNFGTLTALNAKDIHIVDNLPPYDPLINLVEMNKKTNVSKSLREKHDEMLGNHGFEANSRISLSKYLNKVRAMKRWHGRKASLFQKLQSAHDRSSATRLFLKGFGCEAPYFGFDKEAVDTIYSKKSDEKIAVVHVSGAIDDKLAKKVIKSLQEIRFNKNVKVVVLRVDSPGGGVIPSEAILENIKDLPQPVVCSFSNLAASGGYYVSMSSKKIFAQQSTLTGSIGVFGVRFDVSEAAKNYGIGFDSVTSSDHANTFNIFQPLTKKMEMNNCRSVDRVYEYFKSLVSKGRNMSMTEVEAVAQGRVWTGEEAKKVGLCDEFGGLDKAISYCKTHFTTNGSADVLVYPKQKSFLSSLSGNQLDQNERMDFLHSFLKGDHESSLRGLASENLFFCMDEETSLNTAIRQALLRLKEQ